MGDMGSRCAFSWREWIAYSGRIDTFLKSQTSLRQSGSNEACIDAKAYLLQTRSYADISL